MIIPFKQRTEIAASNYYSSDNNVDQCINKKQIEQPFFIFKNSRGKMVSTFFITNHNFYGLKRGGIINYKSRHKNLNNLIRHCSLLTLSIACQGEPGDCNDYVELYDGEFVNSTVIKIDGRKRICGFSNPSTTNYISTGSFMLIRFVSDELNNFEGFQLGYQARIGFLSLNFTPLNVKYSQLFKIIPILSVLGLYIKIFVS